MSKVVNESSLLFLNTKDSISPSTPHNTTFALNGAIATNFDDYTLTVEAMEIPNLVYPINQYTDKLYFKENGGGTITATLTRQNYSGTQLATEVAAAMTAVTGIAEVYTGTFNDQTKKITVVPSNGANSIQFVAGVNDSSEVTGLTPSIVLIGGGVANLSVRLDGSAYVDVITSLSTENYSSDLKNNILFRIPLLVSYGEIMFYQNATNDFISSSSDNLQTFDVRLFDDKGRPWILPENGSVSITLKLLPVY